MEELLINYIETEQQVKDVQIIHFAMSDTTVFVHYTHENSLVKMDCTLKSTEIVISLWSLLAFVNSKIDNEDD